MHPVLQNIFISFMHPVAACDAAAAGQAAAVAPPAAAADLPVEILQEKPVFVVERISQQPELTYAETIAQLEALLQGYRDFDDAGRDITDANLVYADPPPIYLRQARA